MFPSELRNMLIDARDRYLFHLRNGGKREPVPVPQRSGSDDLTMVNASDLRKCALAAALKRAKANPKFPELHDPGWLAYSGQLGTDAAAIWQEAMYWRYDILTIHNQRWVPLTDKTAMIAAHPEFRVYSEELRLKGYADLLVYDTKLDELHVIDFKFRKELGTPWEISDAYAFQTLSYGMALKATHVHIVCISVPRRNDDAINVWTLQPRVGGYMAQRHDGEWFDAKWNTAENINETSVKLEISRHLYYLKRMLAGELSPAPPIQDPLNDPQGWLCFEWDGKKPTVRKRGIVKPNCAYGCHFKDADERREVELGINREYRFVKELPF